MMQKVTDPDLLAQLNGGASSATAQGRASAPPVTQAPAAPVFIPNMAGQRAEGRDETRTGIAVEGNARDAGRFEREGDKERRQGMADLRKEFTSLPAVKNFNEAVTALDTGLRTSNDGSGDATLLYQYSKLMDPMGSVREGDIEIAQSGASYLSGKAAQLMKEFNVEGGGSLPQKVRDGLRREMIARATSLRDAYNQERNRFVSIAKDYGYDPDLTIGRHAAAPFRDNFRAYDERSGGHGGDGPLGTAPHALPRAVGAHNQGGAEVDGVTPKGQGFRPEPSLYHLGNTVADMIAQGRSSKEIVGYLDEQYKPFGVEAGTPMQAKIEEIIRAHKANPSKPIKSLAPGWDSFHLIPDAAETPWYGYVADSPVGAAALGAADIATLGFGDEIAGAIGGDELNAAWDYSREERPYSYTAGQLAGALMLPTGATGAARGAGVAALRGGEGMAAARAAAARAGTTRMTAEGAAYGAAHGAGAADGDLGDRLSGAATEGALGALGGRVAGKVGERVMARSPRSSAPASDAAEYAAAAERQGVAPYAPDMNTRAAAMAGKLAQTQAGVGPMTSAARKTLETAEAARDRLARALGTPLKGEGLGYRIKEGAQKAIKREHDKGQAMYAAAERQAENVRIRPTESFQQLSDEIDSIDATGLNEAGANIFRRVRDRMTQGPMSVETLRNIRTQIREDLATHNIRGGQTNARAQRVMDAITQDIDNGLRREGLDATADLFQQADGQWRAYIELTDDVVTPLIGKDGSVSGEQVVKRLQLDLRGNNARAVKLLNALPPEEQSIARASVIQSLGRVPKGRQGAEGDTFSLSDFLTHWNDIGETAKLAYFGRDVRTALNDLAKVAEGSKAAQRWANHSNSGGPINFPVETVAGVGTLGGSFLATNVTARMLTSPRMVRWLAGSAKKPNAAATTAHIERLSGIAKAEPALANEILNLQSALQQQLSGAAPRSVGRAYAEEEENSRREQPAKGKSDDAQ